MAIDSHALIRSLESQHLKKAVADVRVGETVKVHYKIREGNKERIQVFQGLVIATKGGTTIQGSFTARKVVSGIGVERTFPLHSPWIVKIERTKSGKVRRARLNFVRNYATSSRFKLKDKGRAGTIWEDMAEQKAEAEQASVEQEATPVVEEVPAEETATETVAESAETADNTDNDVSDETVGKPGGGAGSEPAPAEEVPTSESEPQN